MKKKYVWTKSEKQMVQSHSQLHSENICQDYYFIQTFIGNKGHNGQSFPDKMGYCWKKKKKAQAYKRFAFNSRLCLELKLCIVECTENNWLNKRGELVSKYHWLAGRMFANGSGDLGSIFGRIIPKTSKMVLDTSSLNTQQYKVHIKGKLDQSRERSSSFPYTTV